MLKKMASRIGAGAAAIASAVIATAVSAMLWLCVLAVGGAGLVVFGVYLLAGDGWAFIAGGVFALLAAGQVSRGLSANG